MKDILINYKRTFIGLIILALVVLLFLKIINASDFTTIVSALTGIGFYFNKD